MEILITEFLPNHGDEVIKLFNRHCNSELVYESWTKESFKSLFLNNPNFRNDCTFVAINKGDIIGFANGVVKEEAKTGFITMVIVDEMFRKQGIGTQLLQNLEQALQKYQIKRIDCSFFNPINLVWNVPGTNKHQHPNAPGVEYPSAAYDFFLKHNYRAAAKENSYYLELKQFTLPQDIKERIESLKDKKITFEFFDKEKHQFKDLFDKLGNEQWGTEITSSIYGENPAPVLVPVFENQAIGFAGPIYPQSNGRGYFTGIGIHPDFRAFGVGKALFFLLCDNEQKYGAHYMTLFTGEENPARRMYEAAGFKIVHSWFVMRKEGF